MRAWTVRNRVPRTWTGLLLLLFPLGLAHAASLDFEIVLANTLITNQYAGVTFANTVALTAGISLNEFEFPTHSGVNAASDNAGPITINFAGPQRSVAGYFSYRVPITIQAFDVSNNPAGSASSAYANNEALSGAAGSHPGELLKVNATTASIRKIVITGDAGGTSFTVDDLTPISSCDVNQDGSTNISDVQAILNQIGGAATANSDLTGEGAVSVVDLQLVVNAALSLGCAAK